MNPIKIEAKLFASIRQAREYNRIAIGAKKCGLKFNRAYALQLRDDGDQIVLSDLFFDRELNLKGVKL